MDSVSWKDKKLTLKDGVELQSRIWVPESGGPWPALLMRQPYGREIASTVTYSHPSWWASHGYLVVIQDVRGQGNSEGNFTGFKQEASDTTETHAWVKSLPECNGRLGTYGFSYQGLTQLLAEPDTPPPDCIAPAMTGLEEQNHWSCEGGAFWWHIGIAWGLQLAALKARREKKWKDWEKLRQSLENGSYLRDGPALLKSHDPKGMSFEWLQMSNQCDQPWKIHKPLKSWLNVPMLLIGGWWDPHLRGILDIYKKSISAGGNPELHIGPATHLQWWEEVQQIQLNFFNLNLQKPKSKKRSKPEERLWNVTSKTWESPSKEKQITNNSISYWGLVSNGQANIDSNDGVLVPNMNGKGSVHVVHDPWRPVPAIGGHLGPNPGEADRLSIDLRTDVATFTSSPLKETLHLEGIPTLKIKIGADQEGFDLCTALSVVNTSKKKVRQLSTGVLRVLGKPAKQKLLRKVSLQPLLADLYEGESLRLSVAGAAWPAIGVNPGHKRKICGAPSPHCNVITLTINLSESKLEFKSLLPEFNFHQSRSST